jgi:hypothetical protein
MSKKDSQFYIDQIDAYLDGTLNVIDLKAFEAEIRLNPKLKDLIEVHIASRSVIRQVSEQELKDKFIAAFDSGDKSRTTDKVSRKFITLLIGALIFISIVALSIFYSNYVNSSEESQIFALAEIEDPSFALFRSKSESTSVSTWKRATLKFAAQDYHSTLSILDSLSNDPKFLDDHLGKFFLMKGVSNLKIEDYDSAEASLLKISIDNPYYDQGEWYLAMVAYYQNDFSLAELRLRTIAINLQHYKADAAKSYLKSLE